MAPMSGLNEMSTGPALLDRRALLSLVADAESQILTMERAGAFPRRIRIGRRIYWRTSEVMAWLEQRAKKSTA